MTTQVFRQLDELLDGISRTGVVHVGAHRGQEVPDYRAARFRRIVLVEANPALWSGLDRLGVTEVHCCACGHSNARLLKVTDWDERSSLLRPIDYTVTDVVAVPCRPLSELQDGCNVAVIDTQGTELEVLESADLDLLDAVIVEASADVRYHGASTADDIAAFFTARGWRHQGEYPGGHSVGICDSIWRHPTCA